MNEFWFEFSMLAFFIIALMIALYPLRGHKGMLVALVPVIMVMVFLGYSRWGAWSEWQAYLQQEDKQQQIQAVLKTVKSPQELIDKLQVKLVADPKSPRGWYLLGRLYSSQNAWQQAFEAFAKAHALQPDDEQITVNYAQSMWQVNQNVFNETSRGLFQAILQKNPNQPDAIAMLAMDAFMSHDYRRAINYWQKLLELAPPESEDAKSIRKAIAKAQSLISKNG